MDVNQLLDQLSAVIREPTSNLAAASLLLAAVTLVVLIIILALSFFVIGPRPAKKKPQPAKAAPPKVDPEQVKKRNRTADIALVVLALAAIVVGYGVTSTDSYCADTCHADHPAVVSAEGDVHSGVSCVRCHEEPLPVGLVANVGTRLRYAVAESFGTGNVDGASVSSRACADCHASIDEGVSQNAETGVSMVHEHPLDAGMSCDDCHTGIGHSDTTLGRGMSTCLGCHDGETASSDCETCHEGDTSTAASEQGRLFGQVRLTQTGCTGCHSVDSCDDCHGLRMPHNRSFVGRGHARFAAFEKKEMCYRCHAESDCFECHFPFRTSGHPDNWKTHHQIMPRDAVCSCHQLTPPAGDGPFCDDCH